MLSTMNLKNELTEGCIINMIVIFLDIDGVLNSEESFKDIFHTDPHSHRNWMPHEMHLKHLSKIVKETNAKIVISSAWRIGCTQLRMWNAFFTALGYPHIEVIGVTPYLGTVNRGTEIQRWLDIKYSYNEKSNDFADIKFAIIDDCPDMNHLSTHLFKTEYSTGLTEKIANEVIMFLNKGINND